MRIAFFCLSLLCSASPAMSQQALGLAAPGALMETGLLRHILPRFSLKTGVRVVPDPDGPMVLTDAPPGTPVFRAGATIWYLRIGEDPRQQRFRDWLISEIGKRTVESFQPDGAPAFSARFEVAALVEAPQFNGDAARGGDLSLAHCGRCHVIGPQNRGGGIGSTPSFAVLRTFPDWPARFASFFVLRPHPAFTQVEGVTPPFPVDRPPSIVPVEVSLGEIEAILAYVAGLAPADLGAPIHLQ